MSNNIDKDAFLFSKQFSVKNLTGAVILILIVQVGPLVRVGVPEVVVDVNRVIKTGTPSHTTVRLYLKIYIKYV